MRFLFADYELDSEAGELRRGGQVVSLSPRGLQLLTLLLERRPSPVSQRDLRDALWPQTHVGYTSLAQVVAEVRKAIGDEPGVEPMIRTVPRVGYAFVAPAPGEARPPAAAPARLRVPWKAAALGGALLLAGIAGAYLSRRLQDSSPPRFTQLTFRRGVVTSARFSSDGQTVVYSALWDGGPPEIFSRRLDSPASTSLDGTLTSHAPSTGKSRTLPWKLPADPFLETVGTIENGRFLLVRQGSIPARIDRIEIESGSRHPWKTLAPPDATAVGHIWTILVTPDGRGYAYTHGLFLEDLFLVEGL